MTGRQNPAMGWLLHPRIPENPPWTLWPAMVLLAFVLRVGVVLSGDFVIHPDEIMQYLEPAHKEVFGNGVTYWSTSSAPVNGSCLAWLPPF